MVELKPEGIDFMEDHERLLLRALHRRALDEADSARTAFNRSVESDPIIFGQNSLVEEIGKLSRCFNKLHIAADRKITQQWEMEADHRIETSVSLLYRIYLAMRVNNGH